MVLRPLPVQIYWDRDRDGMVSVGDSLLHTDNFGLSIAGGIVEVLNGMFLLNGEIPLCELLAVIDASSACACEGDQSPITEPATANWPDLALCSSDSIMLDFLPDNPGSRYSWTPGDHLSCTDCPNPLFSLKNGSDSNVILQYAIIQEDVNGCLIENNLRLAVRPELAIIVEDSRICEGDSVLLLTTPAVSYNWSGPGINDPTNPFPVVYPSEDTWYSVSLINDLGCENVDSILIRVIPPPLADAGPDSIFCIGSIVQLQAGINSNWTYRWSPSDSLSSATSPTPFYSGRNAQSFVLTVTNGTGCTMMDTVNIGLSPAPELSIPADLSICAGDTIQLLVGGAQNFEWLPGDGLSCTDCPNPLAYPNTTRTYTVRGSNPGGCTEEQTFTIDVGGDLIVEEEGVICLGDTLRIGLEEYTEAGRYCQDFVSINGCDSTYCIDLTAEDPPSLSYLEEITVTRNVPFQLDSLPSGYDYEWLPAEYLDCSDCRAPILTVPLDEERDELVYSISITDENGCAARAQLRVLLTDGICEEPFLFLPTAFSPNGDQQNDFLELFGPSAQEIELRIYDRWGQEVFYSTDPGFSWDGRLNGKDLPTQVFGYYLRIICVDEQELYLQGNISLLR